MEGKREGEREDESNRDGEILNLVGFLGLVVWVFRKLMLVEEMVINLFL